MQAKGPFGPVFTVIMQSLSGMPTLIRVRTTTQPLRSERQTPPGAVTGPLIGNLGSRLGLVPGLSGTVGPSLPRQGSPGSRGNRQPRVQPSSRRLPPENAASGKFLDLSPGYDINKKTFSG